MLLLVLLVLLVVPLLAGATQPEGHVLLGLGHLEVTVAEACALAVLLRTVVVPLVKRTPLWPQRLFALRPVVIFALAGLAALLESLATGKPFVLAVLLAASAAGAAIGAHQTQEGVKRGRLERGSINLGAS